ncbi:hypothetical protein AYO50_01240 [Acidobacteria bacterium SCGC AG-212-P17]|nr:hypothetical protein AYO50_01240 [Acidobacteria bacterium SCGC AG-212-P17]
MRSQAVIAPEDTSLAAAGRSAAPAERQRINLLHEWRKNEVVPLLAQGVLKPNVDSVFPISDIGKAHQRLEPNETFGKVVVVME